MYNELETECDYFQDYPKVDFIAITQELFSLRLPGIWPSKKAEWTRAQIVFLCLSRYSVHAQTGTILIKLMRLTLVKVENNSKFVLHT